MVPVAAAAQAYFGDRSVSHVKAADVPAARVVLPLMPHPVVGGGGRSCSWHPFSPSCERWRWRECRWNPHQWFCRPWGHPTRTCPWWDGWCRSQTCDWRNPWCRTNTGPTWTCDPWDHRCGTHTAPTRTCGRWDPGCGG